MMFAHKYRGLLSLLNMKCKLINLDAKYVTNIKVFTVFENSSNSVSLNIICYMILFLLPVAINLTLNSASHAVVILKIN